MNMEKLSAGDFIRQLASSSPVPGGGGASALVGAVGVALGNMVGSLTVGKKKYSAVEKEVLELKAQSDELQDRLLTMVERDAAVFAPLAKIYGMPENTETEKQAKQVKMEKALRDASQVPLEIMELCLEGLSVIERFSCIGSRLAISDAGVAAACCRGALDGASLNVFINTKLMHDRGTADSLNAKAEAMLRAGNEKADEVFLAVRKLLD